jgi:HSP20 family protein
MLPVIRTRSMFPNWIDEFFGNDFVSNYNDNVANVSVPSVNVVEKADKFVIEVAAPGLKKDDFQIEIDNGVLKISSEKKQEQENKDEKILRREFSYCSFKRTFSLPETIEVDKVEAKHENGILYVQLPKRDEAKVKPIKQISIR